MQQNSKPTTEQLRHWLALWRAPNIGPRTFARILEKFPDLTEFFQISKQSLQTLGLSPVDINHQEVDKDLTWLASATDHTILTLHDPRYPTLLKQIPDPPPVLFIKGNLKTLSSHQLAIVGSRNPTPSGKEHAKYFAEQLANAGLVITSGLALGIDAYSHQGTLKVSQKTIAVLGTGLEKIYPKRNQSLAEEILAKEGTLIAEVPIGTPACPENFPRRNRIISGLCLGVLVVEATVRSGSLITARLANEQGREVFAIPGSIRNPLAQGCHWLIKQGAKLVEKAEDILEELPHHFDNIQAQTTETTANCYDKMAGFDHGTLKLLKCLDEEATPIDVLVERSQLPVHDLLSMLITLELKGYIRSSTMGYARVVTPL